MAVGYGAFDPLGGPPSPRRDDDIHHRYLRNFLVGDAIRARTTSAVCVNRHRRDGLARCRHEANHALAAFDRLFSELRTQGGPVRADILGNGHRRRRRAGYDRLAASPALCALHVEFAASRDRGLRDDLVEAYDGFAVGLARRFATRRESPEDLAQVARIGLLHALDRFDPDRGRPFLVFARSTIIGELKRHVRDHGWTMHVPRSLQEQYLQVMRAVDDLVQELGRWPRIAEVAARAGLSEDQVLEAMEVGDSQRPASLDLPERDGSPCQRAPAEVDAALMAVERRSLVTNLVARLPERDQEVLRLRFVEQLTQSQIAAKIGVSQMCVSRRLSRALAGLRVRARHAIDRGETSTASVGGNRSC